MSSFELSWNHVKKATGICRSVKQGLETCNLKARQSSASHGVRSQTTQLPLVELSAPVKVETIPLLSPTMELELMREPWSFPREPATYAIVNPITNQPRQQPTPELTQQQQQLNVNVTIPSSAWQENFQDLSGWCMTGIQPRCDFLAGESGMDTKLTGTSNEGSSNVLTAANRTNKSLEKTNINSSNSLSVTGDVVVVSPQTDHAYTLAGHYQQHQQQQQQQKQNMLFNNAINANVKGKTTNTWMNTVKSDTNTSNNVWQELTDLGIITIPSNNATTATITAAPMYEPQISFDDLEAKPDNFDLLSYLYPEIPSPNDSVSTDSSRVTDIASLPSTNSTGHVVVSPRTYEPIAISPSTPNDGLKARLEAADSPLPHESPKHSPLSSASSEVTMIPTRHSYRQLRNIIKVEKPDSPPDMEERRSTRARRSRTFSSTSSFSGSSRGRKRRHDDSDDEDDDDDGSYREVREKNNEASRKSRMNKKSKEMEMSRRSLDLEKDNRILKMKVEELEKLVNSMRNALLRSALKREVKTTNMF